VHVLIAGLLAAMAAGAQEPPTPTTKEDVTIVAPRIDRTLPALPPDEFTHCMNEVGVGKLDPVQAVICENQMNFEKHVVVDACVNRDGKSTPPRVIQACTESLDRKIFEGDQRYFLFVDRAAAFVALGDQQRALDDYNEAVKLAPRNADLYYNRGVFYVTQSNDDAALRDFDTALGINAGHVPTLHQRAKIYQARSKFGDALADLSEAIRLQPKSAELWTERGYVSLRQHDYQSAKSDEAEAIRLDPKLARAYFLRGAACGGLGDSGSAVDDLKTAVQLDPSLDRYVHSNGKTASLTLPP
jgi:Tfp pilus assembly protein PilF